MARPGVVKIRNIPNQSWASSIVRDAKDCRTPPRNFLFFELAHAQPARDQQAVGIVDAQRMGRASTLYIHCEFGAFLGCSSSGRGRRPHYSVEGNRCYR